MLLFFLFLLFASQVSAACVDGGGSDLQDAGLGQTYGASDTLCCYGHTASALNDGSIAGNCDCHGWHSTYSNGPHWIQVNFGAYQVRPTGFKIASRTGVYPSYPCSNTELKASFDGVNFDSLLQFTDSTTNWVVKSLSTSKYYRYFRWYLYQNGYVEIYEVEIQGCYMPMEIPQGAYGTGNFNSLPTDFVYCQIGFYCSSGTRYSCPSTQYQNVTGQSSCNNIPSGYYGVSGTAPAGYIGVNLCEAGYSCNGGVRSACGSGMYQDTTGQSSCKTIPSGYYGSGSSALTSISPCEKGYSCSSGVKTICPPTHYQDQTTQASCKPIPSGSYGTGQATTQHEGCTGTQTCSPGYFCVNGISSSCLAGSFSSGSGSTSCTNCSLGTFQPSPAGTFCLNQTICNSTQFRQSPSTSTSDAVCMSLTSCNFATQYISVLSTPTTDRSCSGLTVCNRGTYMTLAATTTSDRVCTGCDAGYSDVDESPATPCVLCSNGTYVKFAGSYGPCSNFYCPAGTTDQDMISTTPCILCSKGTFADTGSFGPCLNCSAGTIDHDDSSNTACVPCSGGVYVPSGSSGSCANFACLPGYANLDNNAATPCVKCGNGTYAPSGSVSCTTCPSGYTDDDFNPATPCVQCSNGVFTNEGSSGPCSSHTCPAGSYDDDGKASTPCLGCGPGSYTPGGASPCSLCNTDSVDDDNNPATPCLVCGPGHEILKNGTVGPCEAWKCPAGFTDHDNSSSSSCQPCGSGAYAPPGSYLPCAALACPAGYHDDDSSSATPCTKCLRGTYAASGTIGVCPPCASGSSDHDESPATPCVLCSSGTYLPSSSFGNCSNFRCSAGTADLDDMSNTPCTTCMPGSYAPLGSTLCAPCPPGSTDHDSSAATSCMVCGVGAFLPNSSSIGPCIDYACPAGSTDSDDNTTTSCIPCSPGQYAARGSHGDCLPCPPSYTDDDGSSATPCVFCPAGAFTPLASIGPCNTLLCPPGSIDHDSNSSTPCVSCELGINFQSAFGETACLPVSSCSSSKWERGVPTLTSDRYCSDAVQFCDQYSSESEYFCNKCAEGYYLVLGATVDSCLPCPAGSSCSSNIKKSCVPGSYQNSSAQFECLSCPPGSFQSMTGQKECLVCPSTAYSQANASTSCDVIPPGMFGETDGAFPGFSIVRSCPQGFACVNGSKTICPPGSYQNMQNATSCVECGLNAYNGNEGRFSSCLSIPFGHFGVGGTPTTRTNITMCPPGSYCLNSTLFLCDPGTYQDLPGNNMCLPCKLGNYNPNLGRTSTCEPIPEGSYGSLTEDQSRVSTIFECPVGSYCTGGVLASCSFGMFQSTPNQNKCLDCIFACATGLTPNGVCDKSSGVPTCRDVTAPVIKLNGAASVFVEAGSSFSDPGAVATDTYDGQVTVSRTPSFVNASFVNIVTVLYSAKDAAGNVALTISRKVTIRDTTPPLILLNGEDFIRIVQEDDYHDLSVNFTDSIDPVENLTLTVTGFPFNVRQVAFNKITYTVADLSGNEASVSRTVQVLNRTIESNALFASSQAYINARKAHPQNVTYAEEQARATYSQAGGLRSNDIVIRHAEASYAASGASSSLNFPLIVGIAVGIFFVLVLLAFALRRRYKKQNGANTYHNPKANNQKWFQGLPVDQSHLGQYANPLFAGDFSQGRIRSDSFSSHFYESAKYGSGPGQYETPRGSEPPTYAGVYDGFDGRTQRLQPGTSMYGVYDGFDGRRPSQNGTYASIPEDEEQYVTSEIKSFGLRQNRPYNTVHPWNQNAPDNYSDRRTSYNHLIKNPGSGYLDFNPDPNALYVSSDYEIPNLNNATHYSIPLEGEDGEIDATGYEVPRSQTLTKRSAVPSHYETPESFGFDDESRDTPYEKPQASLFLRKSSYEIPNTTVTDSNIDEDDEAMLEAVVLVAKSKPQWYHPTLTRQDCEIQLASLSVGEFIVRASSSQPGSFALAIKKDTEGRVWNGLILPEGHFFKLQKASSSKMFSSVDELVAYYYAHFTPGDIPVPLLIK